MMVDCIRELKARVKLYDDEIARTQAKIDVEEEQLGVLKLHKAKLHFLNNRLSDIIKEIEFEYKNDATPAPHTP